MILRILPKTSGAPHHCAPIEGAFCKVARIVMFSHHRYSHGVRLSTHNLLASKAVRIMANSNEFKTLEFLFPLTVRQQLVWEYRLSLSRDLRHSKRVATDHRRDQVFLATR